MAFLCVFLCIVEVSRGMYTCAVSRLWSVHVLVLVWCCVLATAAKGKRSVAKRIAFTRLLRPTTDNISESKMITMTNLQKLYQIQSLINKSQLHFQTKNRFKLQEYVEVLIQIELEY